MSNVHEDLARSRKVATLVDALRAAQIDADLAELLDYEDWIAVAAKAKCKPPSDESKKLVIQHLRAGEPKT